jgi:outer membrane lipoprotein-sorting protein
MIRKQLSDKISIELLTLFISLTGSIVNVTLIPQASSQPTQPPPTEIPNSSEDRSNLEADTKTLQIALEKFFLQQNYQTASQSSLTFIFPDSPDSTITITSQNKIVSVAPNKFRAEIDFLPINSGGETKKYQVISDGETVWIYRPDIQQYTVITRTEFEGGNQSLWLGIASLFGNPTAEELQDIVQNKNLKKSIKKIDNKDVFIYEYISQENRLNIVMAIDPQNQELIELQAISKEQDMEILMQEKFSSRLKYTDSNNIFNFVPPQGTQKVTDLEIEPF